MADIALRGVTKSYDRGVLAVDAVDLDVADGELLVLVGPSGCGKSTLLRMIAGLEEVTTGSVAIGGRDVTLAQPKDRDVAMVFQSYALYPHMSVARNIGYPLRLAHVPKDEVARRVAEVAEVLQLTEVLDRRPAQLSGGQRQRVAMGRAIVRHPTAFLMDEPLSNLDAKLRVEMRAEIARLQRELAVTTVYVTHDQTEAMTMGTRVAVLRDGRLQQVDAPQRLYDDPVNQFVATFIGSPAMNLFAGVVAAGEGDTWSVAIGDQGLDLDAAVLAAHPGLRALDGRPVAVGIRPEAFADAAVELPEPGAAVLTATVDLVESLGAELVVHVAVTDPPPMPEDASPDWRQVVARRGRAVARLGTRSRLAAGDSIRLSVDPSGIHFFDPATGASLRADAASGDAASGPTVRAMSLSDDAVSPGESGPSPQPGDDVSPDVEGSEAPASADAIDSEAPPAAGGQAAFRA